MHIIHISGCKHVRMIAFACENIGAGITVEINYVRTNITFTRAREMPFGGRQ